MTNGSDASSGGAGPVAADVLVVGGGMAAVMAALAARDAGASVVLVRRSPGATALSSGAIGVAPAHGATAADPFSGRPGPVDSARRIAAARPDHPYARLGVAVGRLEEALPFAAARLDLLAPYTGRSRWIATPYGSAAECALCQRTMAPGDLAVAGPVAAVGFRGHLGWDARLVAHGVARLRAAGAPPAEAVEIDAFRTEAGAVAWPHELARALEQPGAAEETGARLREALPPGTEVALFPPVLGLASQSSVCDRIAAAAGVAVAETVADVPSVPGLRLDQALRAALVAAGVRVVEGSLDEARGPSAPVIVRGLEISAAAWVLASGRFIGGGIVRRGALLEPLLNLPVEASEGGAAGFHLARRPSASLTQRERGAPQPLLAAGLRVDDRLRPVDTRGRPVHEALFAAGAVIGGHEHASDGTGLGVAMLTGYLAGRYASGR
ncbi:MAG TPA: FAD-binding protein [Anaeromyxobacteraceae bacterium]|nr:FAD-binding protein [Anaeromyxobacteraceae bacterium]